MEIFFLCTVFVVVPLRGKEYGMVPYCISFGSSTVRQYGLDILLLRFTLHFIYVCWLVVQFIIFEFLGREEKTSVVVVVTLMKRGHPALPKRRSLFNAKVMVSWYAGTTSVSYQTIGHLLFYHLTSLQQKASNLCY
jgi:hypothetical protein